jgi:drug/metabolite transporter (DMT)-like permease
MNWLLRLYPMRWRERYGEEFGAVLASQRASVGLVVDVIGGAIDAHLHPQFHSQIQNSNPSYAQREDTMTLAMLQRCSVGGPKLSPSDRRIASRVTILSALVLAVVSLALTKIYHGAAAVQALLYASAPVLSIVYEQTAYLRKRPWRTQAFALVAGISAMYLFMLAVCLIANRL